MYQDNSTTMRSSHCIQHTSSRQVERVLEVYDHRHHTLFEQVRDVLYLTTLDGKLVDINPAGGDLFGYSRDELLTLNVQELYADLSDRAIFKQAIRQTGSVKDYEVKLRRKDGVVLNCLLTSSVWRDSGGDVLGYQGIIRDITAQRDLQQRLRERNRALQMVISAMPNALLVIDEGGCLSAFYLPPAFPPVIDQQRIQIGDSIATTLSPELCTPVEFAQAECRDTGKTVSFQQEVNLQGAVLTLQVRVSPVSDSTETLIIIDDITALTEAERTIRAYAMDLEARTRNLEEYDHAIAHDLKAPLQALLLGGELLRPESSKLSEGGREILDIMTQRSQMASRMIDSLLLFAKLRDPKGVVEEVDMTRVAASTSERLQMLIQERGVKVTVAAPLLPCLGYAPWLEEVLANLVGNAIKYIGKENSSPSIWIRSISDGRSVRYEVEDNGIGIDPAVVDKLFVRFSRFHILEADGLGLGLSIVERIVSRLGGEVGVRSSRGEGSVFWFRLPTP